MSEQFDCRPWTAHGPLEVSANHHYLQHKDGTPFYWISDTQWALNIQPDQTIIRLLDDRKSRGFTVIQVCIVRWWSVFTYFGDLSWANVDTSGQLPFIGDDVKVMNHPYWDNWRRIIDLAASRGLYVMMMVGSPGRKEGPCYCHDNDECFQYGRQVGAFFRGLPNVLYSASMDFEGTMGVGVEGWRSIAEGILDGDASQDCFLTYHPYTTSSKWFHTDHWLKANGIQGSRNEEPNNDNLIYKRINADYNLSDPVKPVLLLEGSYEAEPNNFGQLPPTTPRNVRMQFFYAFFAGAAGYTYGHLGNWSQYESMDYLDSPGVRQITIARDFLASMDWWKLIPRQSLLAEGENSGERRKAAVLAEDGSKALVFFPEREDASIHMDLLRSQQQVEVFWFNPIDGSVISEGHYPALGVQRFLPPDGWEDAVLVLKSIK